MKNRPLKERMVFASSGIFTAFRSEKSFRFQVSVAIIAICFLGIIQPPLVWWAIIMIMVVLVLFAELMNTALEALCDFVQPDHSEEVRKIKDIAAGAVLILSVGSLFVGLFFIFDLLSA